MTKLEDEITALGPQEWLPDKEHFIFLIDVSSSTQLVLDRMVGAASRALDERSLRAAQQSSLILYTDRIVSETALCDAAELKGVLEASHGGGTDLDAVIGEVLDKFIGVHLPKNLLLFTNVATIQNSIMIGERVCSLGLFLQIFQAVGSGNDETLRELAEACDGRYHRM